MNTSSKFAASDKSVKYRSADFQLLHYFVTGEYFLVHVNVLLDLYDAAPDLYSITYMLLFCVGICRILSDDIVTSSR